MSIKKQTKNANTTPSHSQSENPFGAITTSLAKEILARHQEVLLDHGINTYELPRWLIMDDPHAAMLAAMDPRRKLFVVPITRFDITEDGTVRESAQELYQRFKSMVSAHEEDLAQLWRVAHSGRARRHARRARHPHVLGVWHAGTPGDQKGR